jgi:hypothetical protein
MVLQGNIKSPGSMGSEDMHLRCNLEGMESNRFLHVLRKKKDSHF